MANSLDVSIDDWKGDLTRFRGFYDPLPESSLAELSWPEYAGHIANVAGPRLTRKKEQAPYFVPCLLKDAPLVGRTLERACRAGLPLVGRQRSASHTTTARVIVVDLDGITAAQLARIEQRFQDAGLTYLIFSTYSHGRDDKPGIRCRIMLPVDMAMVAACYRQVSEGLNALFLENLADQTGFALHQQQGVWATAPDREHLAFHREHRGGVCSADALIAAAPVVTPPTRQTSTYPHNSLPPTAQIRRLEEALPWVDANSYDVFGTGSRSSSLPTTPTPSWLARTSVDISCWNCRTVASRIMTILVGLINGGRQAAKLRCLAIY
ncbi:MAG: hypothetical protein NT123_22680 [Proteobacteria bacterium]|nr:hypothetical protein [Pseudomonadota bacterium]